MLRRKAQTGAIIGAVSLLELLFFLPRAASCRKLAPLRSTLAVIIGQHRPHVRSHNPGVTGSGGGGNTPSRASKRAAEMRPRGSTPTTLRSAAASVAESGVLVT